MVKQLYSLFESKTYLLHTELYQSLGVHETRFTSSRQLNKAIAHSSPDIILAEFLYGFGNNYAGVNISNLDVSLYTLQRYAPRARIIIVADKSELPHVSKLEELFHIDAVLKLPLTPSQLRLAINKLVE